MHLPPRPARRLRADLRGAPVVLPAVLDRVSERWWSLPPRVRTAVAVVLALTALAIVGRGATASPWGPPAPVLVATTDLPAGHPVAPGDVRADAWPSALVPADALTAPTDLGEQARTAGPVPAGTVLTRAHLATGVAGLLDPGHTAVPVPRDGLATVRAGDRVDVVAASVDGAGHRVATSAAVLAVDGDHLWLGVEDDRVDAVAAAGAAGRLTLAVRPAGPPR